MQPCAYFLVPSFVLLLDEADPVVPNLAMLHLVHLHRVLLVVVVVAAAVVVVAVVVAVVVVSHVTVEAEEAGQTSNHEAEYKRS